MVGVEDRSGDLYWKQSYTKTLAYENLQAPT